MLVVISSMRRAPRRLDEMLTMLCGDFIVGWLTIKRKGRRAHSEEEEEAVRCDAKRNEGEQE